MDSTYPVYILAQSLGVAEDVRAGGTARREYRHNVFGLRGELFRRRGCFGSGKGLADGFGYLLDLLRINLIRGCVSISRTGGQQRYARNENELATNNSSHVDPPYGLRIREYGTPDPRPTLGYTVPRTGFFLPQCNRCRTACVH